MKLVFSAFLTVGAVLFTQILQAQDKTVYESGTSHQSAAELNENGVRFFQQRDYRRAIDAFTDAYALSSDPNLQFNIARSYEKLGETKSAIEKYEAFLTLPGADTDGRLRAQEAVRSLKKLQSAQEVPQAPPVIPNPVESHPVEVPFPIPDPGASDDSSMLPWVGISIGAVGLTTGIFLSISGFDDSRKVEKAKSSGSLYLMTRSEAQSLIDSSTRKKNLGIISISVGAALATISTIFIAIDSTNSGLAVKLNHDVNGSSVTIDGSF